MPSTVTYTRTSTSTAPLTFSAKGLSTGLTATFNPATVTAVSGTSQLTITATQTAPVATDTLIVTISGTESAGKLERGDAGVSLLVTLPSVTVSRTGTGAGTVTSSPAGINCGSTCAAGFAFGTAVTLTATPTQGSVFAGWSGGCSGTTTTCTATSGSGLGTAIATFNSTAASFSMTVVPTAAPVAQGGTGTATVTLVRNNGFAGAVNLAVTGAPQGLTVTPNPASITGTTSALSITPSLSLPVGNYPITLTATGTGVTQQTATLNVPVTPGQGGNGNVTLSFASCDPSTVPLWLAVQSGNGAWTRLTATNNAFTFIPGATGGFAYVTRDAPGFRTQVFFATASEIAAIATGPGLCFLNPQAGTKRVNGTISHTSQTSTTRVALAGAQVTLTPPNAGYSLFNVPEGKRDLIGTQATAASGTDVLLQKMVLRRNVQYGDGANAPDLDFTGLESFAPTFHPITFTNLAGDQLASSIAFVTANGQSADYYLGVGHFFPAVNSDGVQSYGIPDSLLQSGDFHLAAEFAFAPDGKSGRIVESMFHSLVDQIITFGPALTTPSVTTLGTSPYLRLRTQLASQSAYNSGVSAEYDQGNNSLEVSATAGYFGGAPATWIVDVPDFTGASFDPTWGPHSGTLAWLVTAVGGNILPFVGATMVDGAQIVVALRSNDAASFNKIGRRSRLPH